MRQRKWLELVKDHDCTIFYHPGKAKVVANALSMKSVSRLVVKSHFLNQIRRAQANHQKLQEIKV